MDFKFLFVQTINFDFYPKSIVYINLWNFIYYHILEQSTLAFNLMQAK
jgi:hypothetical protein